MAKNNLRIFLFSILVLIITPLSYAAADQFVAGTEDLTQVLALGGSGDYYLKNGSDDNGNYEELSIPGGSLRNFATTITQTGSMTIVLDFKMINSVNMEYGSGDSAEVSLFGATSARRTDLNIVVNGTWLSDAAASESSFYSQNFSATAHRFYIIQNETALLYDNCFGNQLPNINTTISVGGGYSQVYWGIGNALEADENFTIRIYKLNYSQIYETVPSGNCSPQVTLSAVEPTTINISVNNSRPLQNQSVRFDLNFSVNGSQTMHGFIFSWDNGTSIFKNDSYRTLSGNNPNATVNKTIEALPARTIQVIIYANTSNGTITQSSVFLLNVEGFELTNCTDGYPSKNYTFLDEKNSSHLLGSGTGTFDWTSGSTTATLSKTITTVYNFSICVLPNNWTFLVDYSIRYSATGYPQRTYTQDDSLFNNQTENINLYLLSTAIGLYGRFRIVDSFQSPLSGVTGTMKTSANVTIEIETSDDAGLMTFFVDPDVTYDFTFTKTGYTSKTFSLRITSTDIYTVTLETTTAETISLSSGISYIFEPENSVLNNATTYNFNFNLSSSFWNITACTLYLKNSTTTLASSSGTFDGSDCNVTISYNTGNQTKIISNAIFQLNNTFNSSVQVEYTIRYTYTGNFSLKVFLDDIDRFTDAGFNDLSKMLIAFFVIFGVVAVTASKQSINEPEPLIIIFWAMTLFFSYIGWIRMNYDSIPSEWLKQYIIWIIVTLVGGSYIIERHR